MRCAVSPRVSTLFLVLAIGQRLQRLNDRQMRVVMLELDTVAAGAGCDDQIRGRHRVTPGSGRASQFMGNRPHCVVNRKTRQGGHHLCHDPPFYFTSRAVPQFELDESTPGSFTGFQQRSYSG